MHPRIRVVGATTALATVTASRPVHTLAFSPTRYLPASRPR